MTYRDQHGPIVGFGGLATSPMHHRFYVGGRSLWTWCAWDSLFIPQLLGAAARVESHDPQTGDIVHLDVSPEIVASPHPATAVMSFLAADASAFRESAATVMSSFCHFIFLFASRESGDRWVARHPGTFLYSIDEAATLARRLNAKTFGHELARLQHDT
jgi:alkylmercury lyase